MNNELMSISKFLSYILRHKPEEIGLSLDAEGWAQVDELLAKARQAGRPIDKEALHQVVEKSEKKRFSFSKDGKKIRANYGHSIPVSLEFETHEPPEFLFHGTAVQFLPLIREHGLGPGTRQYVHLVTDRSTATDVGRRHGKPVVLTIKAHMMYTKEFDFYKTEGGIWLIKDVPVQYIIFEQR